MKKAYQKLVQVRVDYEDEEKYTASPVSVSLEPFPHNLLLKYSIIVRESCMKQFCDYLHYYIRIKADLKIYIHLFVCII